MIVFFICFSRMMKSLDTERTRSRAAGDRDSDTIIDLRTALEIEREFRSSLTGKFVRFQKSAIEIRIFWHKILTKILYI